MIHPRTKNDWERILVTGGTGTGKTTTWLNIAKWHVETKADSTFHVIDTDRTVTRSLSGQYASCEDIVSLYPVTDFDQYDEASKEILAKAKPQDWIVVDMIDSAWQAVRDYYVEEVFHKDVGEYFLQVRKDKGEGKIKSLNALEGWVDWQVVNALYNTFLKRILFRSKSHVLCCAAAESVNRDTDSESTVQLFGRFGIKPAGQKNLGFQFSTILCTEQTNKGYSLTTIKDRERKDLLHEPLDDFTDTYLLNIAGWEL